MKTIETTRAKILKYLQSGKTLDSMKAVKLFNTCSLQQHIFALRNNHCLDSKNPIIIITDNKINKKTGTRYAEYSSYEVI